MKEDNSTSLVRAKSVLAKSNKWQLVYKTVMYFTIMYGIPLIILAVLTTFLLKSLGEAKKKRRNMAANKVLMNTSLIFDKA